MSKLKKGTGIIFMFCIMMLIPIQAKSEGVVYDVKTKQEIEKINPPIAKNDIEEEFNASKAYAISITNKEPKTISIPVEIVKDGILNFRINNINNNIDGQLAYGFSIDEEAKNILGSSKLNLDNSSANAYLFLKKGNYHLTFTVNTTDTTKEKYDFEFRALLCTTETKTLKNNTTTISAKGENTDYHKIKITKPSTISFKGNILKEASFIKAILCNNKKKEISKSFSLTDNTNFFVLDKGTYYFKITTDSKVYWMIPQIKIVSDKGGTTVSKSETIKVNKIISGMITLTDKKNKTDYYKIKTTKSGQLKGIYILFNGQGKAKVTIQVPGSEEKSKILNAGRGLQHMLSETQTTSGKQQSNEYPKGTYYIKITKVDKLSSGIYTIGTKKYKK